MALKAVYEKEKGIPGENTMKIILVVKMAEVENSS